MNVVKLSLKNNKECTISNLPTEDIYNLSDHFSYMPKGYQFTPSFKDGFWDGKIRLISPTKKTYPTGLTLDIKGYLENEFQYKVEIDSELTNLLAEKADLDSLVNFIKKFKFFSKRQEIFPREDQLQAFYRAVQYNRAVNICPTSFGKSLCIFMQILYYKSLGLTSIIIVPTVALVHQMANDFIDYCTDESGNIHNLPTIYKIHAGISSEGSNGFDVVVTTWQSLIKTHKSFINSFGAIILDECHKAQAKSVKTILNNAVDVDKRTGWTGSLEESSLHKLEATGIIGQSKLITTTKELMDSKIVANLEIEVCRLIYKGEGKFAIYNSMDYNTEMRFLGLCRQRLSFLATKALSMNKSGLILFRTIESGERLFEKIRECNSEKTVYLIYGGHVQKNDTKYKSIEEVKRGMEDESDAIFICSLGVFSTGISVKNIHWILFSSPFKSFIWTIQSIGRGLRISDTKLSVRLIDIVDDFSEWGFFNLSYQHYLIREAIYKEQQFKLLINDPVEIL